jgi:hypothetical protein
MLLLSYLKIIGGLDGFFAIHPLVQMCYMFAARKSSAVQKLYVDPLFIFIKDENSSLPYDSYGANVFYKNTIGDAEWQMSCAVSKVFGS